MSERRLDIALPFVALNHKANLDWEGVRVLFEGISAEAATFPGTIVICPSMPFLSESQRKIKSSGLNVALGAQDISQFTTGARTGEVAAEQLKGLAKYAIIGHSERRSLFDEGDDVLTAKVKNAQEAGLEVIFCVRGSEDRIPAGVKIVAYEPVSAIGTGNADTPESAASVAKVIKENRDYIILYGGSVNAENVKSFIEAGLDGVLIGGASLKAETLVPILRSIG